jgi:hypothetical protein
MSTGFSGYGPMGGRLGDHRFDRIDRSFRERGIDILADKVAFGSRPPPCSRPTGGKQ